MDWCFSKDNNSQMVPTDEELAYHFTPPDTLLQQIVCRPESCASLDRYIAGESKSTIDELSLSMQGLSYEINRGEVVYGLETVNQLPAVDCGSEILQGLAPKKTGLLGDVLEQLDGVGAINRGDDIFLSSESMNTDLDSQTTCNSDLADMSMACQGIPFEQSGCTKSTSMLGSGLNKCSSKQEVPVEVSIVPKEVSICHEEMRYLEEEKRKLILLQDLQLVIRQMTRDTRVCVRDALYRLAKRSRDNGLSFDHNVPALSPIISHGTSRSQGMHHMESETNVIDRTIANLMFTEVSCEQPSCTTS